MRTWIWVLRLTLLFFLILAFDFLSEDVVPDLLFAVSLAVVMAVSCMSAILGIVFELRGLDVACPGCGSKTPLLRTPRPRMKIWTECNHCGRSFAVTGWPIFWIKELR